MGCNSNFMYRGYMTFTVKFPVEDRAKCQLQKTCRIHTFPLHILHIIINIMFPLCATCSCLMHILCNPEISIGNYMLLSVIWE